MADPEQNDRDDAPLPEATQAEVDTAVAALEVNGEIVSGSQVRSTE